MRELNVDIIAKAVEEMAVETNYHLEPALQNRISECAANEKNELAKDILNKLTDNLKIAEEGVFPICQDTGMACVFLDIGQDVHLVGGSVEDAVNAGVREGYAKGYLRKSVVADPLRRTNTKDNTPAHIVYKIVSGDKVRVRFAPKGFGSENMSKIKMMPPSAGVEGVKAFVLETVQSAGANPCPPIVVGIGIGGTFDKVAALAKEALLTPTDEENPDEFYRDLERELLTEINRLDVGPQGFGGDTTALAVKIKTFPTHIAGLPVAVNINCHVGRHAERIL